MVASEPARSDGGKAGPDRRSTLRRLLRLLALPPDLDPSLLRLFSWVALACFFEKYDLSMLTSALKFIAADLGMDAAAVGRATAWIRLGALPAFVIIPLADRFGRRRLFLVAVAGISTGTALTALTHTTTQFVIAQMMARTFLMIASTLAFVIVTEEFPAAHRGWGIGMLGALGACGAGFGTVLFAAIEYLPFGWRALYAIGVVPLLLLPLLRRGISETARFASYRREHQEAAGARDWLQPLGRFIVTRPRRVLAIGILAGLSAMGSIPAFQLIGYFTQTVRGWTPGTYALMILLGGAVGIMGNIVAGHLGDAIGRRTVGCVLLVLFPACAFAVYRGPGWTLPMVWILMLFCSDGADVLIRALALEVFPTSQRGTAGGWLSLVQTVGAAAGLGVVGLASGTTEELARVTSLVSLTTLIAAAAVFALPETRQRELEAITPEMS